MREPLSVLEKGQSTELGTFYYMAENKQEEYPAFKFWWDLSTAGRTEALSSWIPGAVVAMFVAAGN